ncbi:MAG: hypothetical protein ACI9SC_000465 [Gammaproteobacteria bacterium]|jgi:hypothetical protein
MTRAGGIYRLHYPGKLKHPVICFIVGLIFTFSNVTFLSAAVYKWVDENGKTHYGDKPHSEKAESIRIKKKPTLDPDHDARVEKQRRLLNALDEDRLEAKKTKENAAAEMSKRKTNCAKAQKDLENITNAGFLFKKSDDPQNPTIYGDEERDKITADASKAVQYWCK